MILTDDLSLVIIVIRILNKRVNINHLPLATYGNQNTTVKKDRNNRD